MSLRVHDQRGSARELRKAIIEANPDTMNVSAFCREHGISTWFFWNLRRRFARAGEAALTPASRAPHRVANRTRVEIEDTIVAKHKDLVDLGLDAGSETVAWHLRDLEGVPSPSTIWRVLARRGFITRDPSKAPKTTGRSFSAERANECWQIDDTPWQVADGTVVKIINIIDDCSRLAVASVAVTSCTSGNAFESFASGAALLGWPERFLSDNAKAFRHGLTDALGAIGIAAGHSRPYHPQTCGKVERFHQTLKKFLAAQTPASTLAELQAQLERFRQLYNHHRPHRSLARRTPAETWETTPKSGPAAQSITAATQVFHRKIINGIVWAGRRYQISVGAAFNNQTATVIVTGLACHVFVDGRLARALTLDPTRRGQPIHNRPGRPSRLP